MHAYILYLFDMFLSDHIYLFRLLERRRKQLNGVFGDSFCKVERVLADLENDKLQKNISPQQILRGIKTLAQFI